MLRVPAYYDCLYICLNRFFNCNFKLQFLIDYSPFCLKSFCNRFEARTIYSESILCVSKLFLSVDQPSASKHEPFDTAFATKLGSFREFETTSVTIFGHLAFGHVRDSIAVLTIVPQQILIEASDHIVSAASMMRIFAI